MIPIPNLIDFILHIDLYLRIVIQDYSIWTYAILFAIIFFETGLVVTPFLPGDSLLFAVGSFAALGALDLWTSIIILAFAAIIGDTANYSIGYYLGPKVFREKNALFKKEYLERTNDFYRKYGKKSIVLARFAPILRTFAPFVAGIGKMDYRDFVSYNIFGGVLWVSLLTLAGYFFGTIPVVKENFSIAIMAIIMISFVPIVAEVIRGSKTSRKVYKPSPQEKRK